MNLLPRALAKYYADRFLRESRSETLERLCTELP